jgi:hypothetical protein
VLLEAVGEPLDMVGFEKTVQAVDDLPLKITHSPYMDRPWKKNRWYEVSRHTVYRTAGSPALHLNNSGSYLF